MKSIFKTILKRLIEEECGGCGCGKKTAQVAGATPPIGKRMTIYQVTADNTVVAEFSSLPEARKRATEVGGRVKVTSKVM